MKTCRNRDRPLPDSVIESLETEFQDRIRAWQSAVSEKQRLEADRLIEEAQRMLEEWGFSHERILELIEES